nr:Chain D, Hexamer peptide: SER-ASP-GLU-SER-SER-GLY [Escherichia coli]
SDESSG